MTAVEPPKEVQLMHHNEGFSVVYSHSRQRALRSGFETKQAAIDAVGDWNRIGDFQMQLSEEILDLRYDVDEERAKMGLKPLAEERDGQYFMDEIISLKSLASPTGKVVNDLSRLDLGGSDARNILRLAKEGLRLISSDDVHHATLKKISDFGVAKVDLDGRDAQRMLGFCQEGIDAQNVSVPSMR